MEANLVRIVIATENESISPDLFQIRGQPTHGHLHMAPRDGFITLDACIMNEEGN